jgi:hypothetical protein
LKRFGTFSTDAKIAAVEALHREEAIATFTEKYDDAMKDIKEGERRDSMGKGLEGVWGVVFGQQGET